MRNGQTDIYDHNFNKAITTLNKGLLESIMLPKKTYDTCKNKGSDQFAYLHCLSEVFVWFVRLGWSLRAESTLLPILRSCRANLFT